MQDGYAVIAADGPGDYPVITESRAGNDGLGVKVTPGTVAYVTTGGEPLYPSLCMSLKYSIFSSLHIFFIPRTNVTCLLTLEFSIYN